MTIGSDAIGALAIGAEGEDASPALTYEPVSRIMTGGGMNMRPAELVELGHGIFWDTEDIIAWDDDTEIGWEA